MLKNFIVKWELKLATKINSNLIGDFEKHKSELKDLEIKYAGYDKSMLNITRSQILERIIVLDKSLFSNIYTQIITIAMSIYIFFGIAVLSIIPNSIGIALKAYDFYPTSKIDEDPIKLIELLKKLLQQMSDQTIKTSSIFMGTFFGITVIFTVILTVLEIRRLIKLTIFTRHLRIVDELLTIPYNR